MANWKNEITPRTNQHGRVLEYRLRQTRDDGSFHESFYSSAEAAERAGRVWIMGEYRMHEYRGSRTWER